MKRLIIALSIILLLALSGCKLSDIQEKIYGQTTSGKQDFVGGTKGVEAEIISPVEGGKVYTDQPFSIAVKLSNQGEAGAKGATCAFGSFSECECQEFTLEGKRLVEGERLEGEEKTLEFKSGTIKKEDLGGSSFFITAKTKYDYKTYGIIKACVKKDAYSKEGCQISPTKNMIKSASSAPLSISGVTEEITPETEQAAKLMFTIKLKNSGKGDLYGLDAVKTQCETPQNVQKKINVKLINAPGRSTCNTVELIKGEATTRCTVNNVKVLGESYEPEITVELEYAYETVDSNKFEVV